MARDKNSYTAKDIFVLEGLEPVRRRPAMYIGSTGLRGLHHLIWEAVDNSIDEAMVGYATKINVILEKDNKVMVQDNGRGIPIDKHPQTKKSALETVMTTLHAGAKFDKKIYKVSGGLHGVGISVVCALSKSMKVVVCRDGIEYSQEYSRGKATTSVRKTGPCQQNGTMVIFEPDSDIFPKINFSNQTILTHLREQAYLTPRVKIHFEDRRKDLPFVYNFYFEEGIRTFLFSLCENEKLIQETPFYLSGDEENIFIEIVFVYNDNTENEELSFVNNIRTIEGGTHLTAFHSALTRSLLNYAKKNGIIKKGEEFGGEDTKEGLIAIVSVKVPDPQFEGQTKTRLGNTEVRGVVERIFSDKLNDFLEKNPRDARAIIEKCMLASRARNAAKKARESVLRKGILEGLALPGKLADCSTRDPGESELFIVEGESAGGSSKSARDRRFQAIFPLRGKILNIERAHLDKVLASREVRSLIIALGTAIADDFNIEKLRYHKIIIMCDADSDGNHIKTLLLTLFYRYFREIIERRHLYVANPPLYRIQCGKKILYAYNEDEREDILKSLGGGSISVQRYKGLGEMNPEQLWETTMDPQNRLVKKITIEDAQESDKLFDVLMGKDVLPRKKFIQTYAKEVKNLDI